jgi:hypothetical protein
MVNLTYKGPESTFKSGFKTMIITIFILTLTLVNDPDPQPHLGPELSFKTITIIICILTLPESMANLTSGLGLASFKPQIMF